MSFENEMSKEEEEDYDRAFMALNLDRPSKIVLTIYK